MQENKTRNIAMLQMRHLFHSHLMSILFINKALEFDYDLPSWNSIFFKPLSLPLPLLKEIEPYEPTYVTGTNQSSTANIFSECSSIRHGGPLPAGPKMALEHPALVTLDGVFCDFKYMDIRTASLLSERFRLLPECVRQWSMPLAILTVSKMMLWSNN